MDHPLDTRGYDRNFRGVIYDDLNIGVGGQIVLTWGQMLKFLVCVCMCVCVCVCVCVCLSPLSIDVQNFISVINYFNYVIRRPNIKTNLCMSLRPKKSNRRRGHLANYYNNYIITYIRIEIGHNM